MNARKVCFWSANVLFGGFVAMALWSGYRTGRGNLLALDVVGACAYLWALNTHRYSWRSRKLLALGPILWVGVHVLVFSQELAKPKENVLKHADWTAFALSELPLLLAGVCFLCFYWLYPEEPIQTPQTTTGSSAPDRV